MTTKILSRSSVNQDTTYSSGNFSHAPAITSIEDTINSSERTVVAFYTGASECHPTQRVAIFLNDEGTVRKPEFLEIYSGNPILFNTNGDTYIIYTKFEQFPERRAHWWQYCSLWQRKIEVHRGTLEISKPVQIKFEEPPIRDIRTDMAIMNSEDPDELYKMPEGLGYVTRCRPLEANGRFFLPLYREHAPLYHGVILESIDGLNWSYHGRIGANDSIAGIQPTLFMEDSDEGPVMVSYMRNFTRLAQNSDYSRYLPQVLVSKSADYGKTWSKLEHHEFYHNANNSIAVHSRYGQHPFVVWNDDASGRGKLSLGYRNQKLIDLDVEYGSYPDVCIGLTKLHVVYTAKADQFKSPYVRTVIVHKQFDLAALNSAAKIIDQNIDQNSKR